MRLLYVTRSLPYGPGEAMIIPEIRALMDQGHEVVVVPLFPLKQVFHEDAKFMKSVTLTDPLISFNSLKLGLTQLAARPGKTINTFCALFQSRTPKMLLKNLSVFLKGVWISDFARRRQVDHIHAHWASTTATSAWIASRLSGVPFSLTAHRWDIPENNLLKLKIGDACFVRTIDQQGAQEVSRLIGGDLSRVRVIHMGLSIPDRPFKPNLSRRSVPRILALAYFVEKKGHVYLLEAATYLKSLGIALQLDLIGSGPLERILKDEVAIRGLGGTVNFLGVVSHSQVLERMKAGEWDICVLPSVVDSTGQKEGIPVALIEAMGHGIPVISTTTGGIPELLEDSAGWMVPERDGRALAQAMRKLIEDESSRKLLREKGRQRVIERFDVKKIAAQMGELFERCARVPSSHD